MPELSAGPKPEAQNETSSSGADRNESPLVGNLTQRLEQLRSDMTSALETAGQDAVSSVLEAIAAIDRARTQREILLALVEGAAKFASRAAFFLTRQDKVRGWAAYGFGRSGPAIEGLEVDYDEGPWSQLADGSGAVKVDADGCAAVSAQIDAEAGEEGILIPFVLRGQLAGALYADRLPGHGLLGVPSLLLLTHTAAQELETATIRQEMSPALRIRGDSDPQSSGLPLWHPPAPEAAQEPEAVQEPETTPAPVETSTVAPPVVEETPMVEEEPPVAPAPEAPWKSPGPEEDEPPAPVVESEPPPAVEEEPTAWPGETEPAAEPADEAPPATAFEAPAFEAPPEPTVPEPVVETPAVEVEPEVEAPVVEEPEKEEFEEEPEPELEDTSTDIWALEEDDDEPTGIQGSAPAAPTPPAPVAPTPPTPLVGQETVRLDVTALQGQQAPAPPPLADQGFQPPEEVPAAEPPPVWEPPAAEPPAVEPPAAEPTPEVDYELELEPENTLAVDPAPGFSPPSEPDPVPEVDDSEDPTIISRAPLAEAADPAPAYTPPPVEPQPAAEPAAGSTQVAPPEGLQGPGLAFTQSSEAVDSSQEEALHEEARRLARLLVSEIKLYNEEIIEEGRRNGDIYERLKDDIDRSRQMYEERIDARLQGKEDYFRQELVRRLAGGDENLLGM